MSRVIKLDELEKQLPETFYSPFGSCDVKTPKISFKNRVFNFIHAVGCCEPKEKVVVLGLIVLGFFFAGIPVQNDLEVIYVVKAVGALVAILGMGLTITAKLLFGCADDEIE